MNTDQEMAGTLAATSGGISINAADPFLDTTRGPFGTRELPATRILGVPVSLIDMPFAVETLLRWAGERKTAMVCVRDVHSIMCAQRNPSLQAVHERASMITPDGMPLALISRWRGHQTGRVAGPSLVEEVCWASQETGVRHYFFGGNIGVAEAMAANLKSRFPALAVAGTASPPFRAPTSEEDEQFIADIIASEAAIVWVGISTPKQDFWMDSHRHRLPGKVLIGVGAAFDFHSGAVKRAPVWMQNSGLESLHRLASEPRRLWRRYLIQAPAFVGKVVLTGQLRRS